MGNSIKDNIKKANDVYKLQIMNESEDHIRKYLGNKQIKKVVENYKNGISALNIKPGAHDFVIPSASQILPEGRKGRLLGIFVNNLADHNSGKSLIEPHQPEKTIPAGRENYKNIKKLLDKLRQKPDFLS